MECLKCHTPLPDNSRFCFACGADVTGGGVAATSGEIEGLQARLQRLLQGKYEVKRLLGKGGMGAVFLAHDLTLEREVAIKVLPPDISRDDAVVRRFQQEAKTAAKLDHTNIIPIYRVESEAGLNYFVMKYIAGTSLEDVLERREPLSVEYVQRVLWEAACALGHAHQRGIVHRDVKPANIMFDHDGRVMLTDFGISKALQAASGFTGTGMIIGTPHYIAPEQAKGAPVDGRADQYSLGVVAYRTVTGELPFNGDSVHTILYKHIFEEAPRAKSKRAEIPEHLSAAIGRAMSKDPEQRFATMEEFATAVWPEQPVAAPGKAASKPGGARPRPKPRVTSDAVTEVTSAPTTPLPAAKARAQAVPKKSRVGLMIGLLVMAGGAVGAYVWLTGRDAPRAPLPGGVPEVADIQVAPPSLTLRVGERAALASTAFDSLGRVLEAARVTWSSNNPQVARVGSDGAVTGVAPGIAVVEARAGTQRDQAAVQVTAAVPTGTARSEPPPRREAQRQAPPPAPEVGFITVQAEPYATVYVDGAEIGPTPVVGHEVRPGRHTIRVERAGYRTITETVQVDANNTVRKRYTLIPEG